VTRPFEDPDLISSADRALKNDSQVCPRSQRFGKTAHKPLIVHPNSKPPARDPWFGYFKHGGADRPTLADKCVVHRDSFRREIFSKLAVLERAAEFLLPPSCVLDRVCVDCLIGTAMSLTIRLIVSFEIDSASCNTPGNRRFPNGAFGGPTVKIKLARPSNVD